MSAIGDYIHLTQEGVLNDPKLKNSSSIIMTTRKHILKRSYKNKKQVNLDEISEELSALIKGTDAQGKSSQEAEAIRNAIKEEMNKIYEDIKNINLTKLTIENEETPLGIAIGKVKTKGGNKDVQRTIENFENFNKKINTLLEAMEEGINKQRGSFSDNEIKEIKNRVMNIKKLYKETFNKTVKALQDRKSTPKNLNSDKLLDLRKAVNEAIDLYAKMAPIYEEEGTLLELFAAAINHCGSKAAKMSLKDAFEKSVKGGDTIDATFNNKAFSSNEKVQTTLRGLKVNIEESGKVRRKVDVVINWEGKQLNVSAKNINVKKDANGNSYGWASVVDGAPLLSLAQNLNPDLVNHYLNYYSYHYKNADSEKGEIIKNPPQDLIQAIKYNLFYLGLTNDMYGRSEDVADVFLINDKNGQGIRLVHMLDIIDKIKSAQISIEYNGTKINNYYFKNKPHPEGYWGRISELIRELHQVKVHAKFNAGSLLYTKS